MENFFLIQDFHTNADASGLCRRLSSKYGIEASFVPAGGASLAPPLNNLAQQKYHRNVSQSLPAIDRARREEVPQADEGRYLRGDPPRLGGLILPPVNGAASNQRARASSTSTVPMRDNANPIPTQFTTAALQEANAKQMDYYVNFDPSTGKPESKKQTNAEYLGIKVSGGLGMSDDQTDKYTMLQNAGVETNQYSWRKTGEENQEPEDQAPVPSTGDDLYYRARDYPVYGKDSKGPPQVEMEQFLSRTVGMSMGPRGDAGQKTTRNRQQQSKNPNDLSHYAETNPYAVHPPQVFYVGNEFPDKKTRNPNIVGNGKGVRNASMQGGGGSIQGRNASMQGRASIMAQQEQQKLQKQQLEEIKNEQLQQMKEANMCHINGNLFVIDPALPPTDKIFLRGVAEYTNPLWETNNPSLTRRYKAQALNSPRRSDRDPQPKEGEQKNLYTHGKPKDNLRCEPSKHDGRFSPCKHSYDATSFMVYDSSPNKYDAPGSYHKEQIEKQGDYVQQHQAKYVSPPITDVHGNIIGTRDEKGNPIMKNLNPENQSSIRVDLSASATSGALIGGNCSGALIGISGISTMANTTATNTKQNSKNTVYNSSSDPSSRQVSKNSVGSTSIVGAGGAGNELARHDFPRQPNSPMVGVHIPGGGNPPCNPAAAPITYRIYKFKTPQDTVRIPMKNTTGAQIAWQVKCNDPIAYGIMPHREGVLQPNQGFELRIKIKDWKHGAKDLFKVTIGDLHNPWSIQHFYVEQPKPDYMKLCCEKAFRYRIFGVPLPEDRKRNAEYHRFRRFLREKYGDPNYNQTAATTGFNQTGMKTNSKSGNTTIRDSEGHEGGLAITGTFSQGYDTHDISFELNLDQTMRTDSKNAGADSNRNTVVAGKHRKKSYKTKKVKSSVLGVSSPLRSANDSPMRSTADSPMVAGGRMFNTSSTMSPGTYDSTMSPLAHRGLSPSKGYSGMKEHNSSYNDTMSTQLPTRQYDYTMSGMSPGVGTGMSSMMSPDMGHTMMSPVGMMNNTMVTDSTMGNYNTSDSYQGVTPQLVDIVQKPPPKFDYTGKRLARYTEGYQKRWSPMKNMSGRKRKSKTKDLIREKEERVWESRTMGN